MSSEQILTRIKEIIADVADLELTDIADNATFDKDLDLDSLSLLEIGVDEEVPVRENSSATFPCALLPSCGLAEVTRAVGRPSGSAMTTFR